MLTKSQDTGGNQVSFFFYHMFHIRKEAGTQATGRKALSDPGVRPGKKPETGTCSWAPLQSLIFQSSHVPTWGLYPALS